MGYYLVEEEIVTVNSYAGYKCEERPLTFIHKGRTYSVKKVISEIKKQGTEDTRILHQFKVLCQDGEKHTISYDSHNDHWLLIIP